MRQYTEAAALAAMAALAANPNVRLAEKELVQRAWKLADLMSAEQDKREAEHERTRA